MKEKDNSTIDIWGLSGKYVPGSEGMADKFLNSESGEGLVREVAFLFYLKRLRLGTCGVDMDDWSEAERKLKRYLVRRISFTGNL